VAVASRGIGLALLAAVTLDGVPQNLALGASLADTLMPEAFERGRPVSALATAAGFYLSFVLAES
jgi:hypothetical protein